MKQIYIFDIDETILALGIKDINQVDRTLSLRNPYESFNCVNLPLCYTLNKVKMMRIFQDILKNGDEIGFITGGFLDKHHIQTFLKNEYQVDLGNDFPFYNRHSLIDGEESLTSTQLQQNIPHYKIHKLREIQNIKQVHSSQVILIDNVYATVRYARGCGFKGIYADNNRSDQTNGKLYIQMLETMIEEKTRLIKNKIKTEAIAEQVTPTATKAQANTDPTQQVTTKAAIAVMTTRALTHAAQANAERQADEPRSAKAAKQTQAEKDAAYAAAYLTTFFRNQPRQNVDVAFAIAFAQGRSQKP